MVTQLGRLRPGRRASDRDARSGPGCTTVGPAIEPEWPGRVPGCTGDRFASELAVPTRDSDFRGTRTSGEA